jgi:hypothetical protein
MYHASSHIAILVSMVSREFRIEESCMVLPLKNKVQALRRQHGRDDDTQNG